MHTSSVEEFQKEDGEQSSVFNSYKPVHKTLCNMGYHPDGIWCLINNNNFNK